MRSSIEKRMSNYQCCTLTYCFRLSSSLIKQGIAKINTWGTTWTCFTRLKTWLLPLEGSLVFAQGQVFSGLILPFNLGFCFVILLDYLKLIILIISYCHLLIAQGQLYEHIPGKQYLLPFCFQWISLTLIHDFQLGRDCLLLHSPLVASVVSAEEGVTSEPWRRISRGGRGHTSREMKNVGKQVDT